MLLFVCFFGLGGIFLETKVGFDMCDKDREKKKTNKQNKKANKCFSDVVVGVSRARYSQESRRKWTTHFFSFRGQNIS